MPVWTIQITYKSGRVIRRKYLNNEKDIATIKFIVHCLNSKVSIVTLYETDLWLFHVPFERRTFIRYIYTNHNLWRLGSEAMAAIHEKIPELGGIAALEGYLLEDNPFKRNSISRQIWEKEYREMSDNTTIVTPYFNVEGDVRLIPFDAISKWKYPFITGFQYDHITNEMIDHAFMKQLPVVLKNSFNIMESTRKYPNT